MRGRIKSLVTAVMAAALGVAAPAAAQVVESISPATPDLGNVVSAATGDTVFRVAASSGAVTRVSGNGTRLSSGSTRALVTISCSTGVCRNNIINVRIGSIGSPSGRAGQLTNFTVSPGTATIVTGPTGSNPIDFTIGPMGSAGTATFWVGADFPIRGNDVGAGTGSAASGFYVYVASGVSTPTSGSTSGLAIANVFRPIAVSVQSPLAFGRIVRPSSGSGTVSIAAATGARTVTGTGALGFGSPAPSRASYTVTGEGGQIFSLSFPVSFQMVGPGTPLTVSLTSTATGSQVLSAAAGSAGTFSFGMGGSFPISSTTASGSYQGTYSLTVQYN
jgi:hypothetical protein